MESILKLFSEHGTFVQAEAISYISSKDKPDEFCSTIINNLKEYPLVLTIEEIKKIEETRKENTSSGHNNDGENETDIKTVMRPERLEKTKIQKNPPEIKTARHSSHLDQKKPSPAKKTRGSSKQTKPLAKEHDAEIEIMKDITGNSTCEGGTADFAKLFENRYKSLRKILQSQRREIVNAIPINRIEKSGVKEIQLIGIVKDVRTTSNGHRLIELEDDTGVALLLVLKDKHDVMQDAKEVVCDEIIGVRGNLSKRGDLIIVNSLVFPNVSVNNNRNTADVQLYAAFPSDIHIGSKMFLEKEWNAFIKWVNGELGNSRQKEVANKLKYVVIPGDTVDGIGIYPGQEKELDITDVYEQYQALAEQLQRIPDHISIIIQPGNHDAVRPAEPQPTFEKEIQDLFSGINITFVGNPCYFSLHGVEVASYHGQSLLDFATNIHHIKYNEPVEIMKKVLKKRHLAPTYGGYTPLAPEHTDYMIMERVPDIFVTGHVHVSTISDYRGVTLINASAWQAQTAYQKMLNFVPDPAKLPIVDLQSGNATIMDFNRKKL